MPKAIFALEKKSSSNYDFIFNLLLGFYILSFGVENLIDLSFFGNRILLPEFIFLCLALVFLYQKNNWSNLNSFNKLDFWILGYWASVLLSLIYSQKINALGEFLGCTYLISLYFILSKYYENYKLNIKTLISCFLLSGVFASSIAIIGYILNIPSFIHYHENYYFLGNIYRLYGLMRGPIIFSDYLSTIFLLGLGVFLIKDKKKTFYILYLIIIAVGIILSFSKSGIILSAAVLWLFKLNFTDELKSILYFLLKSFCILLTCFYLFFSHFFLFQQNSKLGQELASEKHSSCESIDIPNTDFMLIPLPYYYTKKSALIAFYRNFPLGIGGNELTNFNHTLFDEGIFNCDINMAPHSTLFGALGELGIPGFICCIFIFFTTFSFLKEQKSANHKIYIIGIPILLFICLQSITTDLMNFRYLWILFFIISYVEKNSTPFKAPTLKVS